MKIPFSQEEKELVRKYLKHMYSAFRSQKERKIYREIARMYGKLAPSAVDVNLKTHQLEFISRLVNEGLGQLSGEHSLKVEDIPDEQERLHRKQRIDDAISQSHSIMLKISDGMESNGQKNIEV